ncbi:NADH dehydrogenase [ubiquinone] complex I, assembly factor 7 [Quaeritorhiza haematococci]|nr:NADH dehydrogenase [ubiquinone] complex I, assembly factor 7 [Quaeritorhiza haematococci]
MLRDERFKDSKVGDRVEISPESTAIARQMGERIKNSGGTALIVDYGEDHVPTDSLRGVRKHKIVHPLSQPGETDVTADVDFSLLRSSVDGLVSAHGPVTQANFLRAMGITTRLAMLLQTPGLTTEQRKMLVTGYERLVSLAPQGMGKVYKVMALQNSEAVPFAFGPEPDWAKSCKGSEQ